jgi:phosphatidylserine decarboxylase
MMEPIVFIDRVTGKKEEEKVYGAAALKFIYGNSLVSYLVGSPLLHLIVKNSLFSAWYGFCQKCACSRKKIIPFIKKFHIDTSEFLDSVESYESFNDFFIRKLKLSVRPIVAGDDVAIIPADARYYFHQDVSISAGFIVKGEKFDLSSLVQDKDLAKRYENGAMVMARLCPTDYHRYHFPCTCIPGETRLINGWLYSVNPIALKRDIDIFTKNKRVLCEMDTESFGKVLFIEIGATNVGSIHQTYEPGELTFKGAEKGYFSFGASSLIILFEPDRIVFDKDLVAATLSGFEIRCLMGQSMGKKVFAK